MRIGEYRMVENGHLEIKRARGNIHQGLCPTYSKMERWSHTLICEKTRSWRDELVDERFASTAP
jgi:hypothetical protein